MSLRLAVAVLLGTAAASAQGVWETRSPLPIAASKVSAAAIGDKIYVVCGITPDELRSNRLFVYDTVFDSWSERAPLPIERGADHCNVAAVNGRLYVLGAIRLGRGFLTDRTFAYDPASDAWTEKARMSIPRGGSGVAVIGSTIYLVGGEGAQESGTAVEAYDTETDFWRVLPDLPVGRTRLTAEAVDGKLHAMGGQQSSDLGSVRGDHFLYDPATEAWTRRAALPTPRGGLASGVIGGRIQVFGGEGRSGLAEQTFAQVDEYDVQADAWRTLAPMPEARHGFYGASTDDGRVFLAGGGPSPGFSFSPTNSVFYLEPGQPPVFGTDAVLNAASFQPAIAPGTIVSLFGQGLASGAQAATAVPLPTRLNATELRIGGAPAPLFFVGSGQINFQIPFDAANQAEISVVRVGVESVAARVDLVEAAPAIFTLTQDGVGQAAAVISGTGMIAGQAGAAARPAQAGEALEIYCTGLGAVTHPPEPGAPAGVTPLSETLIEPEVRIGGRAAQVLFSGLAPGFVGVYQVNAFVPNGANAADAVSIELRQASAVANAATIAVR